MSTAPILALDSNLSQITADAVVVLFILVNMYLGWRFGLTRRIIAFGGTYLGALGAYQVSNAFASLIGGHDVNTGAWSFVGFFLAITVAIEGLALLYGERIKKIVFVPFERSTGIVGGAVVGFFEVVIIFSVAIAVSGLPGSVSNGAVHGISAESIRNSSLGSLAIKAKPAIYAIYGPVLPNDLGNHIASGAKSDQQPTSPNQTYN